MKKIIALCLFLLFSLFPGLSHAQDGNYEEQAIAQLINEISQATD